ncbi:BlaI/MecI/CopY family transcriptional regulator [bacterium]|nr:BlaI/MecI/CopY family transcriptional regulator [bacterium]MBQ3818881.1 BlaI/MecI/CopY family transcriptional regulator [bacterium]
MTCGSLEIEILNSFWKLTQINDDKDISIQDIVDDMSSNGVERAYTTIKTVMDRLVAKSVLVRYKSGKKFFYKAVMSKDEMAADSLNTVCEQFFNGSRSDMIRFIERSVQDIVL